MKNIIVVVNKEGTREKNITIKRIKKILSSMLKKKKKNKKGVKRNIKENINHIIISLSNNMIIIKIIMRKNNKITIKSMKNMKKQERKIMIIKDTKRKAIINKDKDIVGTRIDNNNNIITKTTEIEITNRNNTKESSQKMILIMSKNINNLLNININKVVITTKDTIAITPQEIKNINNKMKNIINNHIIREDITMEKKNSINSNSKVSMIIIKAATKTREKMITIIMRKKNKHKNNIEKKKIATFKCIMKKNKYFFYIYIYHSKIFHFLFIIWKKF